MIDQVIRGLATTSMETLDQFITEEVTNHLFEDKKVPFSGLDLVALNLQRGESRPSTEVASLAVLTLRLKVPRQQFVGSTEVVP